MMLIMLRRALIAPLLLAASLGASAHGNDYIEARVINAVPHLSLSFGSLRQDGFRVEYEVGGARYDTYSRVRPGPVIIVPPPVRFLPPVPFFEHRRSHWREEYRRDGREHRRWEGHRRWRDHDDRERHHGRHEH